MIKSWALSIYALIYGFFFWIAGGFVLDKLYTYSFEESVFVLSPLESSLIKSLYAGWDYVPHIVLAIIFIYLITYTIFKR